MTRSIKWFSITLVLLIVSIQALLFFLPLPPLMSPVSFSRAVYDEQHHLLRLTLSHDSKYRLRTPLAEISPQLIAATLLQEDQYYYYHAGINPISILKAGWQTYVRGSRRVGASTITMQVARMRYKMNSKTLAGKAMQIIRARQLEMHYSKEEILEAYLNLAPYGGNVEGAGAASWLYFNKPIKELALPEVLTLVVIPQNPIKRLPERGAIKKIRYLLYQRWLAEHPADKNKQALMDLPLQMRSLKQAPFLAPHFVNEALLRTNKNQMVTTLDLRLQKMVEHVTEHYLSRKHYLGVNNAAVMIIDTRNMGVKAMLGSADFFSHAIGGQINGAEIKRSPGSTLKPFIYALAFDQGIIHPATVLKDVPRSFGSYNPENFDNDFVGPVKAKDALILSRNIPAVYLADLLKHPSLYEFLQQSEVAALKSEAYYGLSLVLGGAEVTMHELASLYAALANDGRWKPLRFYQDEPSVAGKRLLSPEASFLVLDILKDTQLPGTNYGVTKPSSVPVAWKTGTSSGYRDAWTVGVAGPYVVAVWIGNFDNKSNAAFVGKDIAAPLFLDITNAMHVQLGALTAKRTAPEHLHLTKVAVCKASGMLPTRYCDDTEPVWFIPGKSPITTDTIYREVAIDKRTGLRTCHFDDNTKFAVYEFWTSDLLKIFKQAGIQRRIPPTYDVACTATAKSDHGFAPQITSPHVQVNYVARVATIKDTIIPFSAVVDADVRYLHWFVNETFIGKTTRDQALMWHAKRGDYIVRVVDDYGRSDARNIKVNLES